MPAPTIPPDVLLGFAARQLGGPATVVADLSTGHAESAVWRVRAGGTRAVLKAHRTRGKFERERHAYERLVPAVGGAPRLLAVHEAPPALLLEELPGRVDTPPTSPRAPDLHRAAGAWLARLHALPYRDDDPLDLATAYRRRTATWFRRAAGRLPAELLDEARARIEAALPALRGRRRVPCHRDFTPRNWLATESGGFAVIDFEHARPDLAESDLVRLSAHLWPRHPGLREAFLAGYGPASTPPWLAGLELLEAVATVSWAGEHGDAAFADAGRAVLRRHLRAGR